MTSHNSRSDKSIDEILDSIRNVISMRKSEGYDVSDEELELTEIIEEKNTHNNKRPEASNENSISERHDNISHESKSAIERSNSSIHNNSNNAPKFNEVLTSKESRDKAGSIIEDFIETADTLGLGANLNSASHPSQKDSGSLENFMMQLLKPQLKSWLDENLPTMVKQVVSEEIKSLVANMQRNRNV